MAVLICIFKFFEGLWLCLHLWRRGSQQTAQVHNVYKPLMDMQVDDEPYFMKLKLLILVWLAAL